ncbi:hypothetical protein ACOSP7_006318 [Xanthoceras sorbifolium]
MILYVAARYGNVDAASRKEINKYVDQRVALADEEVVVTISPGIRKRPAGVPLLHVKTEGEKCKAPTVDFNSLPI